MARGWVYGAEQTEQRRSGSSPRLSVLVRRTTDRGRADEGRPERVGAERRDAGRGGGGGGGGGERVGVRAGRLPVELARARGLPADALLLPAPLFVLAPSSSLPRVEEDDR